MSFEWFVARRYLTARRRQAFISLISLVSILGVGVGVAALVIALALMTGVQEELRDRIVGSAAHVYVYKFDGIRDIDGEREQLLFPGVEAAAPAILDIGMVGTGDQGNSVAVAIKGVDPVLESTVSDLGDAMREGTVDALIRRSADDLDAMLIGSAMAEELGVAVGDRVFVMTPRIVTTPGGLSPKIRPFRIVGVFEFGFYDADHRTAVIGLDAAMSLLGREGPDLIQLRLADLDAAPVLREDLQREMGSAYFVQDWTQINEPLYAALWLEKVAISMTIGLIIMVAALNIVASLVLLVMEKSRDIAILRTMGASALTIRRIFIYQGATIGLIGTMAGASLGLVVAWVFDRYQLIALPADVYQITYLPFHVEPFDIVLVVVSAVVVCFAATLYPSRRAGQLDPAEALRN